MGEPIPMISSGAEQALKKVLSLLNDDMMNLDWNLKDELKCIQGLTSMVIEMLRDADMRWLAKLEEVAYEAEDALDDLSYEILRRKVHNNPLSNIRFLRKVVFSSQIARKLKNLNQLLDMIYSEAQDRLRLLRRFSGYLMPSGFRPCLGFWLGFPRDFLVQKTELMQLWLAAGLIQSYDEGNGYLEHLVSRFSQQDVETDEDGNVVAYRLSGLERFENMRESLNECNASCVRYIYATTPAAVPRDRANKLRTLILDGVPFRGSWKLERLGILVFLNSVDTKMLPSSIGRMKHLRYLDVSNTRIRALPEFITNLYNLQTLRFLQCEELNKLPKKFNNLINLKNIAFSFEYQMPFRLGLLTCLEMLPFFVVGSNRGGSIEELRYLNGLRGNLEITRLEEVRDPEEAEIANLHQKMKINELSFQWSHGAHGRSSCDEQVLESLCPHPNICKIKIKYYMGENWPSWTLRTRSLSTSDCDSSVLNSLVSLTLERCWNCIQLPCLGDLPCLKFLTIQHMERVKFLYNELYRETDSVGNSPNCLFPALKSLSLSWMENLTEWSSIEMPMDSKKTIVFPRLETLSIQSCAKLKSFPMNDSSKIAKIEIKDCEELRFLFHELPFFPFLKNLSIERCPKLTCLRNWVLSNAQFDRFRVRNCEWLKFISNDLGLHRYLVSLEINCCKGLVYFSEEIFCKLTRLRKLSIGAFSEKMDDFCYLNRIKDLPCLEMLELWGSDFLGRKMSRLPDQLQHLTSLPALKIKGFATMEALPEWLSNLKSLSSLSLNYCWRLEYQSTATILQKLPNLKLVYFYGCHNLEQNKSQWNEFSRITNIKIMFHS